MKYLAVTGAVRSRCVIGTGSLVFTFLRLSARPAERTTDYSRFFPFLRDIMLDKESSLRLKLLRFPPIIGVLYIHAYGMTINYAGGTLGNADINGLTEFIRTLISQGLARTAVPLFFLMSGYLFFANFQWSQQTYGKKILTRFRTLLVPYLFWNILAFGILALGQAIPIIRPYFTGASTPIADYIGWYDYLNALFGLKGYPIAYHFWFIRDLLLLVLLAPVIAVILRYAPLPFFIGVFLCWVCDVWPVPPPAVMAWGWGVVPVFLPAAMSVFFFAAGAFCGIKGKSLFALDTYGTAALIAYVPIVLVDAIWYTAWFNVYLHRTGLLVGVAAALYSTRLIARHELLSNWIVALGGTSFFVYAAHEPLLGLVRTFAYKFIPLDGAYTMLLLYLTLPVLVIVVLVLCHRMLTLLCPRALSLVTGGR